MWIPLASHEPLGPCGVVYWTSTVRHLFTDGCFVIQIDEFITRTRLRKHTFISFKHVKNKNI